jgi:hypothetical protein
VIHDVQPLVTVECSVFGGWRDKQRLPKLYHTVEAPASRNGVPTAAIMWPRATLTAS